MVGSQGSFLSAAHALIAVLLTEIQPLLYGVAGSIDCVVPLALTFPVKIPFRLLSR
jgi:hypothetical protein